MVFLLCEDAKFLTWECGEVEVVSRDWLPRIRHARANPANTAVDLCLGRDRTMVQRRDVTLLVDDEACVPYISRCHLPYETYLQRDSRSCLLTAQAARLITWISRSIVMTWKREKTG
jgi:hypothetical protein